MRGCLLDDATSAHRISAWLPSEWMCVESTPRSGSSVATSTAAPAPSPKRTAMSRPRVVASMPVDWISTPTRRIVRYWPVRIQASATERP